MVTNVTSLLKTVKAVEDEHTRGTRALEATIEAIAQEIRALDSPEVPRGKIVTPEDLVRATRPLTTATAKAVAAGASCRQDDVIVAANVGRKTVSDLLTSCKSAASGIEGDLRERLLIAARQIAVYYRELLQFVLHAVLHPGTDVRLQLTQSSREIANSVTELGAVGQLMKGSAFEDPDDPTVIAENELLGAANSIDAAAKKLEKLRPRRSIQETDESLNFDEMILEAAKSIAAATSALVKAASAAQRELIDSGRVSRKATSDSDDGQWSDGLVSAAQLVAAATHSLVEAANSLVQGHATEEKLISAAKQVASSTAQLLVACKVKASPDSDSTRRLQAAGNAVKRATDNLVRAAQQALAQEEERQLVLNRRMVGGIAQEINARSDVLRIEKELEEARSKLAAIRKAKYQEKTGGMSILIDESDVDVDTGPEASRLDSLLEASVERINNTNNSINLMRHHHYNQQYRANPYEEHEPLAPTKPYLPYGLSQQDHKISSRPNSTLSNESSHQDSLPQPLPQSSMRYISDRSNATSEDGRCPESGLILSPTLSYMKPSEFYSNKNSSAMQKLNQTFPNTGSFGKAGQHCQKRCQDSKSVSDNQQQEDHKEEYSHYDSGPISSEEIFETATSDGKVSLMKVQTSKHSSTTRSVVSSSKKVIQKRDG